MLTQDLQKFLKLPKFNDFLYRLPWYLGIICSAYLLICWFFAMSFGERSAYSWMNGSFRQFYFATSMLIYLTALNICLLSLVGWKRKDFGGLMLILVFLIVLLIFIPGLFHKTRGFMIWPM